MLPTLLVVIVSVAGLAGCALWLAGVFGHAGRDDVLVAGWGALVMVLLLALTRASTRRPLPAWEAGKGRAARERRIRGDARRAYGGFVVAFALAISGPRSVGIWRPLAVVIGAVLVLLAFFASYGVWWLLVGHRRAVAAWQARRTQIVATDASAAGTRRS